MWVHPGTSAGNWIPLTFHIVLTLDLSNSNPSTQHVPPLPPQEDEDMRDIDLLRDYIFLTFGEDSDYKSHHVPILIPSPLPEAVDREHSSSDEVKMSDSDQSDDSLIGKDKLMNDLAAEDEDMEDSEEEKDLEENQA